MQEISESGREVKLYLEVGSAICFLQETDRRVVLIKKMSFKLLRIKKIN